MSIPHPRQTRRDGVPAPTLDHEAVLEVADLGPDDLDEAIGVLERGMRDNPLHVAAFGRNRRVRARAVTRLQRAAVLTMPGQEPIGLRRGGRLVAVIGSYAPGRCRPSPIQSLRYLPMLAALGPRAALRIARWLVAWRRHDPREPHSHLGPVAVDAPLQGQGLGTVAMREYCRRMDARGWLSYLETDKPENVRFYRRLGYEVVGETDVLGTPTWFMRRAPQPRDQAAAATAAS